MAEVDESHIELPKSINTDTLEQDSADLSSKDATTDGHGTVISAHYNTEEAGLFKRNQSRILHLRNFNNWTKSMLLDEYIEKIKSTKKYGERINALDLCCGRGGDLRKWQVGGVNHVIFCDIAAVALENCRNRYDDMKRRCRNIFTAEFYEIDLTKLRARQNFKDVTIKIDIVSCQFAFHYCFESLTQAETMMKNVTECLNKGGYFIGTIPNAYAIVAKQQAANSASFGNEVYNITFEEETIKAYPLFGGKYNFHLDGVVDCPEFLVYFPLFVKLAQRYGLELVSKKEFPEYFLEKKEKGLDLLKRMSALEVYDPRNRQTMNESESKGYSEAKKYCEEHRGVSALGTLSEAEWEVASLYLVFAFQKVKTPAELFSA